MAQGCNLKFTAKDLNDVKNSMTKNSVSGAMGSARNILNGKFASNPDEFIKILERYREWIVPLTYDELFIQRDKRYKVVRELLIDALGRGQVPYVTEQNIPHALLTVLKFQGHPSGLFHNPPKNEVSSSRAIEHPYELLSSAALIQKSNDQWDTGTLTSLGEKLKIYPGKDEVHFGVNLNSSSSDKNVAGANTIIVRDKGLLAGKEKIGIDARYSKGGSGYSNTYKLSDQLKEIRNTLNKGELSEFYFVTNQYFSSKFVDMVEDANIALFKQRLEKDTTIQNEYLSALRKEGIIVEDIRDINFRQSIDTIHRIAKESNIPQIGMAKKVHYQGPR